MQHIEVSLEDKYVLNKGKVFITGIQALVRLPLEQALRDNMAGLNTAGFISGYRGSPLGGYDMQLQAASKYLKEKNVHFWPGLNEDLGATAVWGSQQLGLFEGAQYDGVFGLWYGKAPGVDRTGDVFKHANFAGTSKFGGALAIAGDDHNCKSSTLPSQSEFAFIDAEIPVLSPSNIQEVLDYGLYGIAMSRFCGSWIALIATADTMDSGTVIETNLNRIQIKTPENFELPLGGLSLRRGDEPMAKEARLRHFKLPAALAFVRENKLNRIVIAAENKKLGIIASGQAYNDLLEALDYMGIDEEGAKELGISILKIAMPWPLDGEIVKEFAKGHKNLLVVEHKRPLMEDQIKAILYDLKDKDKPIVCGKKDANGNALLSDVATLQIHEIGTAIAAILGQNAKTKKALIALSRASDCLQNAHLLEGDSQRKPHFCSGCPHNTSTVVPEGSRALAGIGCHYMANFMADRATDMTSHMGGEGIVWVGQAPFTKENHVFANLGDGTYSHSGSLAIRAAVTAGVNITYKLLYNDAVAMTGGQHTESGQSVPQIAKQLLGEGVAKVVVVTDDIEKYNHTKLEHSVTVYDRKDLGFVQNMLKETKGVTVLIYEQMCATEKRRRIKRKLMHGKNTRVFINPDVCEGCGDCSKQSNCLSIHPIETELGTKREIDQSSCNQDTRCIDGFCPSFVSIEGATNAKRIKPRPEFDATLLPLPQMSSIEKPYSILFMGVGGTGVTTVSAIIGMAAHIDGNNATTLDMTGLAQKGGQVLSHIRIARGSTRIHAGRIPVAKSNAAIVGDLIVATNLDALKLVSKETTKAVANWDIAPTSEFIYERNRKYQSVPKIELFGKAVKDIESINAEAIANEYLYDAMFSNMVLLGYAWQKGLVPISLRALYRAIKLNQAAVNDNMLAFDLGRIAAHDPQRLTELVPPRKTPEKKTLDELINHRSELLKAYQNQSLARKYQNLVEGIRMVEKSRLNSEELTYSYAENLFKLMAYKDEYEVARLYSNPEYWSRLKDTLTGEMKISLWLAPPLFAKKDRHTGLPIKSKYGPWIFTALRVMKNFKFLRGTFLDPFGGNLERKTERKLIKQFIADFDLIAEKLNAENFDTAVKLAQLPQEIRGYGHVKEKAVEKAMKAREVLLGKI